MVNLYYTEDGLRTAKTVGSKTTVYVYNDGKLMREFYGNDYLDFFYDADGKPFALNYNGTYYYYILNLQGDVIRLIDGNGITVAAYEYDPYGKIIYASGSMASINPLRYRGYYYDNETGLYYLQSRYYDPQTGRFISPDSYTSTGQGILGHNMFAYCGNNPVSRADNSGEFWNIVIGAAVGAVVGVAGQFVSDLATSALNGEWTFSNWQTYTGAAIGGAVGGAVLGGTGNVGLANAASGFVTTGVGMSLEKVTGASDKSWTEIGVNALTDGAISYGLGKLPGIKNVTKGRNNMSAVYKSGLTKLRNKTVSHMSEKVVAKGLFSGFVGGLAMDGYYGLKQFGYNPVRDWLLD